MDTPNPPGLARRLEIHGPLTLLAVGARARELLGAYPDDHPECRITCLDDAGRLDAAALLAALADAGRFDFAVVRGVLERMDHESGGHLLAGLRDVHSRRFCVVLDTGVPAPSWPAPAFAALGLARWPDDALEADGMRVYGFDLERYKRTPEWLNARHWAHPEHWGKFRW